MIESLIRRFFGDGFLESESSAFLLTFGLIFIPIILVGIIIFVLYLICDMFILKKADRNPWIALIPFYRRFIFCNIALDVEWFGLAYCLLPLMSYGGLLGSWDVPMPIVSGVRCALFIMDIIFKLNLAKKFGKSTGFAVGLILLPIVFYPILAFGKSKYISNAGDKVQNQEQRDEQSYTDRNDNGDEILNDDYSFDNEINTYKDDSEQNEKSGN